MLTLEPPPELDEERDLAQTCELLGITHQDLINEINYRLRVKFERALKLQRHAANVQGERRLFRMGGELGEVTQQLHPVLHAALRARFGPEALEDPAFRRELHREHPETKVVSRSDRLTIVRPDLAANLAPNIRADLSPVRTGVRGRRGRWAA